MKSNTTLEIGGAIGAITILVTYIALCLNIIIQLTNFFTQLPVTVFQK